MWRGTQYAEYISHVSGRDIFDSRYYFLKKLDITVIHAYLHSYSTWIRPLYIRLISKYRGENTPSLGEGNFRRQSRRGRYPLPTPARVNGPLPLISLSFPNDITTGGGGGG